MNARRKLNAAYLQGALLLAGLLGWASGSWVLFILALLALLLAAVHSRKIRW